MEANDEPHFSRCHPTRARGGPPSPRHRRAFLSHRSGKSSLQGEKRPLLVHPAFSRLQGHSRKPSLHQEERRHAPVAVREHVSRAHLPRTQSLTLLASAAGGSAGGSASYDLGSPRHQAEGSHLPALGEPLFSFPTTENGPISLDLHSDDGGDIPPPSSPRPRHRVLPVQPVDPSSYPPPSEEWLSVYGLSPNKRFSKRSNSDLHTSSSQTDAGPSGSGTRYISVDEYPPPPISHVRSGANPHEQHGSTDQRQSSFRQMSSEESNYWEASLPVQSSLFAATADYNQTRDSAFHSSVSQDLDDPPYEMPESPRLGYISDSFDDDEKERDEAVDEPADEDPYSHPILGRHISRPLLQLDVRSLPNQARRSAFPKPSDRGSDRSPGPGPTDLFPSSQWKLEVEQFNRSFALRGMRFPGYPPSPLGPNQEWYNRTQ